MAEGTGRMAENVGTDGSAAPRASQRPENASALVPSQRLRVAYLLTLVGGFLDAYTYFERGGVFANAQTGNIVKLGIALANGERERYLFFLAPISSFALGLLAALIIEEHLVRRGTRLVRRSVLAAEMLGLALVGLIPLGEEWNMLANCLVAFVAAMQFEAFKTFRGESITTTMSTGNLRKFVENLFAGIVHHDAERLHAAGVFGSIIATFICWAILGTRCCDWLGRAAVLPAIAGLAACVAIITVLRRRNATA